MAVMKGEDSDHLDGRIDLRVIRWDAESQQRPKKKSFPY